MNTQLVFVAATAALWAAGPAAAAGHVITGPRLSVTVADPDTGWTPDNANRVDHIAWVDSSGAAVQNWVANGGPLHCNDPQEFFGQAYGEPEGAWPPMVIAGYTSTWSGSKPMASPARRALSICRTPDKVVGAVARLGRLRAVAINSRSQGWRAGRKSTVIGP